MNSFILNNYYHCLIVGSPSQLVYGWILIFISNSNNILIYYSQKLLLQYGQSFNVVMIVNHLHIAAIYPCGLLVLSLPNYYSIAYKIVRSFHQMLYSIPCIFFPYTTNSSVNTLRNTINLTTLFYLTFGCLLLYSKVYTD